MDNPQLGHFYGVRKYFGGDSNSPVAEWLDKGLMAVSSPAVGFPVSDWSVMRIYLRLLRLIGPS
eukprot:7729731-Pyramimonas_sp.AAC.1